MYIQEDPNQEQMQELCRLADDYNREWILDYDRPSIILAWTLIHRYRLVLRPSRVPPRWICGCLKGMAPDGKITCVPETIVDAPCAETAVYWAALKTIQQGRP